MTERGKRREGQGSRDGKVSRLEGREQPEETMMKIEAGKGRVLFSWTKRCLCLRATASMPGTRVRTRTDLGGFAKIAITVGAGPACDECGSFWRKDTIRRAGR